jgi:hypothetical protein
VASTANVLNHSLPLEARPYWHGKMVSMVIPGQIAKLLDILPETTRLQVTVVEGGFLCQLVRKPLPFETENRKIVTEGEPQAKSSGLYTYIQKEAV